MLATLSAGLTRRAIAAGIVAFAAAFSACEGALFLASFVLPSGGDAFAMRIAAAA